MVIKPEKTKKKTERLIIKLRINFNETILFNHEILFRQFIKTGGINHLSDTKYYSALTEKTLTKQSLFVRIKPILPQSRIKVQETGLQAMFGALNS
jgi:hypothetical protein